MHFIDGSLPIDSKLGEALELLDKHPCLVVEAPTGSGKTTRLPLALLSAEWRDGGRIILLEPRRVAARAAARRMASTLGSPVGQTVGWQIRFEKVGNDRTPLMVLTEGLLLRLIQDDPFLEGISAVVLDEFHERSLNADIALAMLLQIQREVRPELRIIVMSATLDGDKVAAHMGDAPRLRTESRLHPVDIRHLEAKRRLPLNEEILNAADTLLDEKPGDVLTFLPGAREIRDARAALSDWAHSRGVELVPLYGDLPPDAQERALQPGARRRVILATNVAETSVTLPNVTGVIDTGQVKRMIHDAGPGLDRLTLGRVSLASAQQRAGRAGRVQPGICIRLWTEADEARMAAEEVPELLRRELSSAWLQLISWGDRRPESLPWLDPPTDEAAANAIELLRMLRAVDGDNRITERGRAMAALPLPPRLAAAITEARRFGVTRSMASVAALMEEREIPGLTSGGKGPTNSDIVERLHQLERARSRGNDGRLSTINRLESALVSSIKPSKKELALEGDRDARDEAICRSLIAGWPDRVAMRRTNDPRLARMVGGHGLKLGPSSRIQDTWLWLAIDVQGAGQSQAESLVYRASAIREEWLKDWGLKTETSLSFDDKRGRVIGRRELRYHDLVLRSQPQSIRDNPDAPALLAEAIAQDIPNLLQLGEEPIRSYLRRLDLLKASYPDDATIPTVNMAWWRDNLGALVGSDHSLGAVLESLLDRVRGQLGWQLNDRLERELPTRIELSNGRRGRITWPPGGQPVLAMRIQELFGVHQTPKLAGGRVELLLHLLAPNGRPQQITTDLESFWHNTWAEVRRELRARYPKHAWPEDPLTAQPPQRRARR